MYGFRLHASKPFLLKTFSQLSEWMVLSTNSWDTTPEKKQTSPPSPPKKSVSTSYLTLISFLIYRVAIIAVVTMLVGFVAIKAMVFGKDVEYFSR